MLIGCYSNLQLFAVKALIFILLKSTNLTLVRQTWHSTYLPATDFPAGALPDQILGLMLEKPRLIVLGDSC